MFSSFPVSVPQIGAALTTLAADVPLREMQKQVLGFTLFLKPTLTGRRAGGFSWTTKNSGEQPEGCSFLSVIDNVDGIEYDEAGRCRQVRG